MPRLQALLALLVLLVGPGCLRHGYEDVMRVHQEVLLSMAEKLCGMAQAGTPPAAEAMGEFVYPGKRARQFEHYFEAQDERESYRLFAKLVDLYDDVVRQADGARRSVSEWRANAAALCAARDSLRDRAQRIRHLLEQGG